MADAELKAAFTAVESITETVEKVETSFDGMSASLQNLDNQFRETETATKTFSQELESLERSIVSGATTSQMAESSFESMEEQISETERKVDRLKRSFEGLNVVQGMTTAQVATNAGAMKVASNAIDEMGDEAIKSASQLTVLDTVMQELSLSGSALSVNIGAFNVSLRNLAPLVPIAASMGSVVTVAAALASAIGAAAVAFAGFMAGGAVQFFNDLQEEFEGLTNDAQTLEAIIGGLRDLFAEALEPLEGEAGAEFFVDVVEGVADFVNRLAQAIDQMRDNFMPLFTGAADIINDEFDEIANAVSLMMDRMTPILLGLFDWFMKRLPDALEFASRVTQDLVGPANNLGESLIQLLGSVIETATTVFQGLAPAFSVAIDLARELVDLFNVLSNGFLQAAIFLGSLTFAARKFVGIADTMANIGISAANTAIQMGKTMSNAGGAVAALNDALSNQFKHLGALRKIMLGTMSVEQASGQVQQDLKDKFQELAKAIINAEGDVEDLRNEFLMLQQIMESGDIDDNTEVMELVDERIENVKNQADSARKSLDNLSAASVSPDVDLSNLGEGRDPSNVLKEQIGMERLPDDLGPDMELPEVETPDKASEALEKQTELKDKEDFEDLGEKINSAATDDDDDGRLITDGGQKLGGNVQATFRELADSSREAGDAVRERLTGALDETYTGLSAIPVAARRSSKSVDELKHSFGDAKPAITKISDEASIFEDTVSDAAKSSSEDVEEITSSIVQLNDAGLDEKDFEKVVPDTDKFDVDDKVLPKGMELGGDRETFMKDIDELRPTPGARGMQKAPAPVEESIEALQSGEAVGTGAGAGSGFISAKTADRVDEVSGKVDEMGENVTPLTDDTLDLITTDTVKNSSVLTDEISEGAQSAEMLRDSISQAVDESEGFSPFEPIMDQAFSAPAEAMDQDIEPPDVDISPREGGMLDPLTEQTIETPGIEPDDVPGAGGISRPTPPSRGDMAGMAMAPEIGEATIDTENFDKVEGKLKNLKKSWTGFGRRTNRVVGSAKDRIKSFATGAGDDLGGLAGKTRKNMGVIRGAISEGAELAVLKFRRMGGASGILSSSLTFASNKMRGLKTSLIAAKGAMVRYIGSIWTTVFALYAQANAAITNALANWANAYAAGGATLALKAMAMSLWGAVKAFAAATLSAITTAGTFISTLIPAAITTGVVLNAALGGIPILLAAIIGVSAAVVGVLGNMDSVASGVGGAFNALKSAVVALGNSMLKMAVPAWNLLVDIVELALAPFIALWDGMMAIAKALGLVSDEGSATGGIVSTLMGLFDGLMAVLGDVFKFASGVLSTLGNALYTGIVVPFKIAAGIIKRTVQLFKGLIGIVMNRIPLVSSVVGGMIEIFNAVKNAILSIPQALANMAEALEQMVNNIIGWFMDKIRGVVDVINGIIDTFNKLPGANIDQISIGEEGLSGDNQGSESLEGLQTTADEVRENTREDEEEPDDDITTRPDMNMSFKDSIENNVDVQADPEDKAQLSRITKDALEEANSFARRQQGGQ